MVKGSLVCPESLEKMRYFNDWVERSHTAVHIVIGVG